MVEKAIPLTLRKSWLLSIFLIVPLVTLVGLWDWSYNQKSLLPYLQLSALSLPIYLLFFEMPHIFASMLSFFDKEYLEHYRKEITYGLPLIVLCTLLIFYINLKILVAVYLIANMYHVVKQLTGVSLMFGVAKNRLYSLWTWLILIGLTLGYSALFGLFPDLGEPVFSPYFGALGLLIAVVSLLIIVKTKITIGKIYVISILLMFLSSNVLLNLGYIFLAVFVFRFIHDVTAFMFYITHEVNRNKFRVNNIIYKFMPLVPVSLAIMVPILAITLSLLLSEYVTSQKIYYLAVTILGFSHFYLESIMWKRDSPHRQYVTVR